MLFSGLTRVFSNELEITDVNLTYQDSSTLQVRVQCDLAWNNSYRDTTSAASARDAVWLFAKYKVAGNSTWKHVLLNSTSAGWGYNSSNRGINVKVPSNRVGCILESNTSAAYTGAFTIDDFYFTWNFGAEGLSCGDTIEDLRIYGLEMVYIPEAAYKLGDGSGADESTYAFHPWLSDNNYYNVTTAAQTITVDANSNDDFVLEGGMVGLDGDNGLIIDLPEGDNSNFPTGYRAFYAMKYEITQGNYRDFLNTLTQAQQNNRVQSDLSNENDANTYVMVTEGQSTLLNRQTIKAGPNPADGQPYTFGCDYNDNDILDEAGDGEWIAMNYLKWQDLCAFADWAGLRPLSEAEYEKICRGTAVPLLDEYSWATTTITDTAINSELLSNPGTNLELSANVGDGLCNWRSGNPHEEPGGPQRVGSLATGSTTRVTAGSGYYGNMELTGNVSEMCVSLGNTKGRAFQSSNGNGYLTLTSGYEGNAENTDWPGIDDVTARGVTGSLGAGFRGGGWNEQLSDRLRVSDRQFATYNISARNETDGGGRLGLSEP